MAAFVGQARRIAATKRRRIIWSESARRDLEGIRAYITIFNPAAARRMAERLLAAADSLEEFGDRGRPVSGGRRELLTIRPYLIRYRIAGDVVYILRIRHAAQDRLE